MTQTEHFLALFKSSSALLDGHFRLTSGKHSNQYFQCARVLQYPKNAEVLCSAIAKHYQSAGITLVISPAIGGIVVGQEVGRLLGVRTIFAERDNGEMKIRRGFEIFPDDNILICEDVITTGGSVREVYDLLKNEGHQIAGVASIVDRSNGKAAFDVPYYSIIQLEVNAWEPDFCPLCKEGVPVIKPGSRVFKS
ncbi:MAG: orotate phosphoribosyltransferase [Bacteroidetes bacterium]|nr:orotate phosphoribosyltransferase [Bacteroidota bacterium]